MKKNTFGILTGTVAGLTLAFYGAVARSNGDSLTDQLHIDSTPPDRTGPLGGYADIVDRVSPSVVSIAVSKNAATPSMSGYDFLGDPRLRRFFGQGFPQIPDQNAPKQEGLGSGVVLTEDGYIATNNHVIEGADEIKVSFAELGKTFDAKLVGTDPQTDLAVLKVEATGLTAATLGDNKNLKVGDTVLAIGSPFGLSETVTSGIVSAMGRTNVGIMGREGYENFIQTDASINPGNSGGALIDNKGRVVGINTAILSRTGSNVGIGFAIPINMVTNVAEQLIQTGTIQRGYLGVMLGDLTPELAKALHVQDQKGVLVNSVMEGTPAAEAGLKNGDVIVQAGGEPATDMTKLRLLVSGQRPGSDLPLKVLRDGNEISLNAKIGQLDSNMLAANGAPGGSHATGNPKEFLPGVEIANLNANFRQQLDLDNAVTGVVVTAVKPHSPADAAGLQPGDVITSVARQDVNDVNAAVAALAEAKGDVLLLYVTREGVSRFVAVDMK